MIWIGLRNYFIWMVIYLGIGTVLSLLLPFPYALGVMLIVIFLGNIIKTEIRLRKTGLGGIKSKVQVNIFVRIWTEEQSLLYHKVLLPELW